VHPEGDALGAAEDTQGIGAGNASGSCSAASPVEPSMSGVNTAPGSIEFTSTPRRAQSGSMVWRSNIGFWSLTCMFMRVGAEYSAALCDLGVFMDKTTEPISSNDLDVGLYAVA
jgi:hypothetical protein